ncbi:MAG: hypothetical protein HOQ05_14380 [Corynebacteriales bacterium]|nr:hypothetical protein [Mycobacteriales bacterium]
MVQNRHSRILPTAPHHVWELLTNVPYELISSAPYEGNGVFPDAWGGFRAPSGFIPNAPAGHGPFNYIVKTVEPGRRLMFKSVDGKSEFGFVMEQQRDHTKVSYVLDMPLHGKEYFRYQLVGRHLHNAWINDVFDNIERAVTLQLAQPAQWSPWVKLLRRFIGTVKVYDHTWNEGKPDTVPGKPEKIMATL